MQRAHTRKLQITYVLGTWLSKSGEWLGAVTQSNSESTAYIWFFRYNGNRGSPAYQVSQQPS